MGYPPESKKQSDGSKNTKRLVSEIFEANGVIPRMTPCVDKAQSLRRRKRRFCKYLPQRNGLKMNENEEDSSDQTFFFLNIFFLLVEILPFVVYPPSWNF